MRKGKIFSVGTYTGVDDRSDAKESRAIRGQAFFPAPL
jgi:hypothetical protein